MLSIFFFNFFSVIRPLYFANGGSAAIAVHFFIFSAIRPLIFDNRGKCCPFFSKKNFAIRPLYFDKGEVLPFLLKEFWGCDSMLQNFVIRKGKCCPFFSNIFLWVYSNFSQKFA